ncbi:MAG TPA: HAD-IA family hydrolase [Burkholderiales bacterium]|nr:HAD-IA family hydrolase [Burkholderiales bacterium]
MIRAVLFDLDGTLADTAPDLAYALNTLRGARGMPPLPLDVTRPVASQGARGLIGVGFGVAPGDPGYDALRDRFLTVYEANLCRLTTLFPGMPEVLAALEERGMPWGVVTNKLERFTHPLLDALKLSARAACVVGGDTTLYSKPHPAPLLAASRMIDIPPEACLYVGDDRRDVEAGHAAGMKAAVAGWGYLNGNDSETWAADWMLGHPEELIRII